LFVSCYMKGNARKGRTRFVPPRRRIFFLSVADGMMRARMRRRTTTGTKTETREWNRNGVEVFMNR
jgi:hypothetical protein